MKKHNIKNVILVLFLVAAALLSGVYIGSKNTYFSKQVAEASGLSIPEDLKDSKNFEQFYEVWQLLEEKHPRGLETSAQDKMWGAISGLVDSLGDPYTVFFPPKENEDFNIDLKGQFSGVGMEVGVRDEGITVVAPLKDSPAEQAGIKAGDVIIKIDDTLTSDLDIDQAIDLIRGPKGTSVTITVLRKGEDSTRDISVVRDIINLPVIETQYLKGDDVFVIQLFSFNEDSAKKFEGALNEFVKSKAKYLVVDLRNNPGGYLSAAVDISSWFLEEGEVIVKEDGKTDEYDKTYRSAYHFLSGDYKMAVLVNGGSASASEIMAGALQEHGRAKLVGTQTYGKGSVQELIPMESNTSLKVTVAEWLTPSGVSISKEGLSPDLNVEFDTDRFDKDGTDNQLEEAIKLLKKEK